MEAACDEAAVRGLYSAARAQRLLREPSAVCRAGARRAGQPGLSARAALKDAHRASVGITAAWGPGHMAGLRRRGRGCQRDGLHGAPAGNEDAPAAAAGARQSRRAGRADARTPAPTQARTAVVNAAQLPTCWRTLDNSPLLYLTLYRSTSTFPALSHERPPGRRSAVAAAGTEMCAAADGVVLAAQEHYSWGNFVEIDHGTDADGLRWVTLYAHMQSCAVVARADRDRRAGHRVRGAYRLHNRQRLPF